ncbi:putative membrane protein [Kitasatospora atroaurantiaca]|uniref:Putative membrane protein n=1 Tax=Kitasatospora atroaurantiaca TaxID=285545 RepID=A0A561EU68_9ACTN|nr:putative membrane protein [Kitasatospora atroaurantiaca]
MVIRSRVVAVLPPARRRTLLLTLLCFAVSLAIGLQKWSAVQLGGFDLGIFDQGVRGYAHFGLPTSALKSFHHEFPPGFSLLGDHFSPVLALLAPLYWLWDDPRSLILGQALLFAAGVPLIRRIAARSFAAADARTTRRATDLAGLVYGLGWPLLIAARGGFHEVAFAVPLTLLMLERGQARRYATAAVAAVLLCCTKEDLGLMVGAFGLVLILRARRSHDRRGLAYGLGLLLGGPLAAVAAIRWLIPAMGGQPGYYWNYGELGPDAGSAAAHVLGDPLLLVQAAFGAPLKPLLLLWLVGTTLALPLRSATVLCAAPLIAERILSDNPNHWSIARHYDAFLWPILLTAALEALGRLYADERTRRTSRRLGVAVAGLALAAAVPLGLVGLFTPSQWQPKAGEAALVRAAAQIPDGASVEADNQAAPRLTARTDVVLVDGTPRGREYVLTRSDKRSFPFATDREQAARIDLLLAHGYRQIWAEDGVVLLHRTGTEPVPGVHVPGPDSVPVQDVVPSDVGHNLFRG